jgi:hypothetical protein
VTDFVHGAFAYGNGRCRCDICLAGHRDRIREARQARHAARVLVDGRLVATTAERHGVESTYTNHGCRCQPCTQAHTGDAAEKRIARRSAS